MEENRLIEFVKELDSKNIRDWDNITKELRKRFDSKFRLNDTEANYLTSYYKGLLNFNTPIIEFKLPAL